jgi:cytochrome P450 family 142 subfamily A polypeptide 1
MTDAPGPTVGGGRRPMSALRDFESTDLTDPTLYDDPWDFYAWLRSDHPVWFDERSGLYALSRHADVVTASVDTDNFSSAQGVRPVNLVPLSIVSMDNPEHSRQRRILSKGFTPRQIRSLTGHVRELTGRVIDEVESSGEIDFVSDLAMHVPLIVISELLGLDPSIRRTLYDWSDAMIAAEAVAGTPGPERDRAATAFFEYTTLIGSLIEERRAAPRDDLLSILTAAYDSGELAYDAETKDRFSRDDVADLSDDELMMFCVLLMVAGNETTRNAIAGGLRALSQFPDQRERLVGDPTLMGGAVEEILRWVSPVLNFTRTVTGPVTLSGVDLVPGDRVLLLYQSANRDEAVFGDADRFRIDRDPNPHVAFGFGTHFCLGSNLARMEISVVFEELFRRLPDIVAVDPHGPLDRSASAFVAGIHHLPARFTPVVRPEGVGPR